MDEVKKYKKRRDKRMDDRGMRWDDEEGRWVTTEKKHKVHINGEGVPDKGNPHVISVMKIGGKGTGRNVPGNVGNKRTNYRNVRNSARNRFTGSDYVGFLKNAGMKPKKESSIGEKYKEAEKKFMDRATEADAPPMEDDMKRQGYEKNDLDRWEKKQKSSGNGEYQSKPVDGGNKEYGYGSGDNGGKSKKKESAEEYDDKKVDDFLTAKKPHGAHGFKETQAESSANEIMDALRASNEGWSMMDEQYNMKHREAGAKMMDQAEDNFAKQLQSMPVGAMIVAKNDFGEKMTIERCPGKNKGYRIQMIDEDGTIWRDSLETTGGEGRYSGSGAITHNHEGESKIFNNLGEFDAKSIKFEKSERYKKEKKSSGAEHREPNVKYSYGSGDDK